MYTGEYDRSVLLRYFKFGRFLKYIFAKSHPYLNIYHLKEN